MHAVTQPHPTLPIAIGPTSTHIQVDGVQNPYPQGHPTSSRPACFAQAPRIMAMINHLQRRAPTEKMLLNSVKIVSTLDDLQVLIQKLGSLQANLVALDCEGLNLSADGTLCTLQLGYIHASNRIEVSVVDVLSLGSHVQRLKPFLEGGQSAKFVHDCRNDCAALKHQFGIDVNNVFDTQLAHELLTDEMSGGTNRMFKNVGIDPSKGSIDHNRWATRPLTKDQIIYASMDVYLLYLAIPELLIRLERLNQSAIDWVSAASRQVGRKDPHQQSFRQISFDPSNFQMRTFELLNQLHPEARLRSTLPPITVSIDVDPSNLPSRLAPLILQQCQSQQHADALTDLTLELGQPVILNFGARTVTIPELMANNGDIQELTMRASNDSMPSFHGHLNRCDPKISTDGHLIGAKLRIGRATFASAALFADKIHSASSILLMGGPGLGKTSMLRDMVRVLSLHHTVAVVEAATEICGNGISVHPGAGIATKIRLRTIPHLTVADPIADAIYEVVRHGYFRVLVVDGITSRPQLDALKVAKQHGLRIFATFCGHVREIAMDENWNQCGAFRNSSASPIFDTVIVSYGTANSQKWGIINNMSHAIESATNNATFRVLCRTRIQNLGFVHHDETS